MTDVTTQADRPELDEEQERPAPFWQRLVAGSSTPIGLILAALVLVFSVLEPNAFLDTANARNIATDAAVLLVLATGMTYVIITAGIDLSVGAVLVFSGVVSAKAMNAVGGDNWGVIFVGLAVALAGGLAWGLINGFLIAKAKIPAFVVTLGTLGMALGASLVITGGGGDEQGGGQPAAPGQRRDNDGPAFGVGIDGCGRHTDGDPGRAAGQGEQDGLGQELDADVALGGTQGPAEPDLAAAFEDGDDHDVGHPDGADEQGNRAQAKEKDVERALGGGLGGQRGRGLGDVDLGGVFRVGLGGEQVVDGPDLAVSGAQVDGGGMPVEPKVFLGSGVADQDRGVDLGSERCRPEDPGYVEPHAAGPDPLAWPDPVDAQPLRRRGAEHRDRLLGGGSIQVGAQGDRGADGLRQVQAGSLHRQGVGVDGGDQRAAVGVDVADGTSALHLGDTGQPGDHSRRGVGQLGGAAGEVLAVGDREQVGAQPCDLGVEAGRRGLRQAEDGDDGGHADPDPQRRQPGPQPVPTCPGEASGCA
jgi:hypothetical protein